MVFAPGLSNPARAIDYFALKRDLPTSPRLETVDITVPIAMGTVGVYLACPHRGHGATRIGFGMI